MRFAFTGRHDPALSVPAPEQKVKDGICGASARRRKDLRGGRKSPCVSFHARALHNLSVIMPAAGVAVDIGRIIDLVVFHQAQ